ncbi:MAG: hypothetical protein R6W66_03905 [Pelovirga sp.]
MIRMILWLMVAVAVTLAGDWLLMQRTFEVPGLHQGQRFYRDFRTRLLNLNSSPRDPIGQAIEAQSAPEQRTSTPRFLYVDRDGELHFADHLEQIPAAYRQTAQPLAR